MPRPSRRRNGAGVENRLKRQGKRDEEAITSCVHDLAREGGRAVADILGTDEKRTLDECTSTDIWLPLDLVEISKGKSMRVGEVCRWITELTLGHHISVNVIFLC